MKVITIITRGDTFKVNEKNQITYSRSPVGSDKWLLRGAVDYRFGRVWNIYTLEDIRARKVPWKYKNGKQRCHVIDYDHGTYRVWMSPGLIDVTVTEETEVRVA